MMQNNYYFLKHLSNSLKKVLVGMRLGIAFTQNKDELIVGFCKPDVDFYIRATLEPRFTCLNFLDQYHRAKKNTVELFEELLDLEVLDVVQFENDRSFSIILEQDKALIFKMHGSRSNILLWDGDKVKDLFLKKHHQDWDISPQSLERNIPQDYDSFVDNKGDFTKLYPTLHKSIKSWLFQALEEVEEMTKKWEIVQACIQKIEQPLYTLCLKDQMPILTLFPMQEQEICNSFEDPIKAINEYYYMYLRTTSIDIEKNQALKSIKKQTQKATNYITKSAQKLQLIKEGGRYEEIANILMANLNQIPSNTKSVKLFDFYQNKELSIKIKPDLSPQKNAENYYRKGKNSKFEVQNLQNNILEKEASLKLLKEHIEKIEEIDNIKALRKYLKEHIAVIQEKKDELSILFKKFQYENYTILVGKNAKNNDLLTQRYTYKEDLWLHAKDVSGSHVVIKHQAGKVFPQNVIEKAAKLAAYYSKRKNDSLSPVIFTPKKYVRKSKSLADGQVIVEKEDVIMVTPEPFG